MAIKLDEFYTVEDDTNCWTLTYKKATGKTSETTGDPTYTVKPTYHANLRQALSKYLDESLKGSSSLDEVLNRITEVEARIESIK